MFNFFADPSQLLVNIVLLLAILVVLVVIHELGHFVVARRAGVTVHEFGIGFPPRAKVLGTDSKGTTYTLNWLPIGGFVKLEGEDGGESDDPNAFSRRPLRTRLTILLAGVVMNLILAFVIFTGIAMFADPIAHVRIAEVQPNTPAASVGLVGGVQTGTDDEGNPVYDESGDVILAIDGRRFPVFDSVESPTPSLAYLRAHAGEQVTLTVRSADGTVREVPVTLRIPEPGQGALGIVVHPALVQEEVSHGPVEALVIGAQRTFEAATLVLRGLGDLVTNLGNPQVSGPVGIVDTIGQVRAIGAPVFLIYLIGLLSANLAIVNALPFPPLDGGRVAVALIQKAVGQPHQRGGRAAGLPDGVHPVDDAAGVRDVLRHTAPGLMSAVDQPAIQEGRQAVGRVEGEEHLPGRRQTPTVNVGGVSIGSRHPIVVQSMTNTDTADADATALQVAALAHAGSELVRITVNNDAAAAAVPEIRRKLDDLGIGVPLIGDFHYNGHQLLVEYPDDGRGAGQVPHQPGQRRREAPRRELRDDHPRRARVRPPGAHRRQLGLARPGAADDADGRQRQPARPGRLTRRDDRGDGPIGAALGRARRGDGHGSRPDHHQRQGVAACATSSTSTARSPAAATTRFTSG